MPQPWHKHRPAAAILVYAALNAASAALCRDNLPNPSKEVDDLTPPCFLCTAADDTLLGTEPTLAFAESLSKFKIRYEMHIYPQGGHGFANGHTAYHANPSCRNLRNWQQESIAFLEGMFGQVTTQGVGEATLSAHVTADRDDYLSVGCTVAHLRLQHMAAPIFDPVYAAIEKTVSRMFGPISAQIMDFVQTTPLDAILHLAKTTDDQVQALDTALLQIPNEKEAVSL